MSNSTDTNATAILADEVFLRIDNSSANSKTVRVVINKFLNEIKQDNEKRVFKSNVIQIGRYNFTVDVYPKSAPQWIGVFLNNLNDIDIQASLLIKVF